MDEVDKIVFASLREIGYVPEDPSLNLKSYQFQELVSMVIHCLRVIREEDQIPSTLPTAMSARYNLCSKFAQICKELGYDRDIGYQTFMYSNLTDIRNVLLFLIEHLPKKSSFEEVESSAVRNLTTKEKVCAVLQKTLLTKNSDEISGLCKVPFLSTPLETGTLLPNQKMDCQPSEWKNFVTKELPYIDEQVPNVKCFLPSIISLNCRGLINPTKSKCSKYTSPLIDDNILESSSSFPHAPIGLLQKLENLTIQSAELDEEKDLNEEFMSGKKSELESNSEILDKNEVLISELHAEIETYKNDIHDLKNKLNVVRKDVEDLRTQLIEKKKFENTIQQSIALLPNSEENIPQLEAANEKCRKKIKDLENQWKIHRDELLSKKNELQLIASNKSAKRNALQQQVTNLQQQLIDVYDDIKAKKRIYQKLEETKIDSGLRRSEFILRINDMIVNIHKQDIQIDDILNEIKQVQREMGLKNEVVYRTYGLCKSVITKDNGDWHSETYKYLEIVHNKIQNMIESIDKKGKWAREIEDLDEQIREEECNKVEEALTQAREDLKKVKEDQSLLIRAIKEYGIADNVLNLLIERR